MFDTGLWSRQLRYHRTNIMPFDACKRRMMPLDFIFSPNAENFLCTETRKGKSVCIQDAGNPLVWNDILIGVASWTVECSISYPDLFTRIIPHLDWISKQIEIDKNRI